MDFKSKIRGMLFGVAIGDALGSPHENQPAVGRPINTYPETGGQTTDDWQMTAVVANALMKANCFNINHMANEHIAAYEAGTRGWGGAHRNACLALKQGASWKDSGKMVLDSAKPFRGRGNGMCMKISPMAAYHTVTKMPMEIRLAEVARLTMMTHATGLGFSSAVGMEEALMYCFSVAPGDFTLNSLFYQVKLAVKTAEDWIHDDAGCNGDKLSTRIGELEEKCRKDGACNLTPEDVMSIFKGGGYAYESLPFSLAFFCMGRHDCGCIYDCVGSGGDTDTNGSMVAAMVGALHGEEIFSKSLLYKLIGFPEMELLVSQFTDWCLEPE